MSTGDMKGMDVSHLDSKSLDDWLGKDGSEWSPTEEVQINPVSLDSWVRGDDAVHLPETPIPTHHNWAKRFILKVLKIT